MYREQKQKSNKVNGIQMIGIFTGACWMDGWEKNGWLDGVAFVFA